MAKNFRKPHRIKRKKSLRSLLKNKFFWLGIFLFFFFILAVYFLFFSSFFRIKNIEIFGNEKIQTEQIRNIIEKDKNIFLFNVEKNKENILEAFPEIAEVKMNRSFPETLKINIEERKPVAVFCQDQECFFIDKQGILYEKTDKHDDYPQILGILNNNKTIDQEQLDKILKIISELDKQYIKSDFANIISQIRIDFQTSEGWQIFFNIQKDIDWQLIELKEVLEKEISPEKREKLEYIDLRFEKVYYK